MMRVRAMGSNPDLVAIDIVRATNGARHQPLGGESRGVKLNLHLDPMKDVTKLFHRDLQRTSLDVLLLEIAMLEDIVVSKIAETKAAEVALVQVEDAA